MSSSEEEHQVQLIRWVRQRIHEELEATKEETYEERDGEGMLDLEIDAQMATPGEASITEETEREAAKLVGQLRAQAEETAEGGAEWPLQPLARHIRSDSTNTSPFRLI